MTRNGEIVESSLRVIDKLKVVLRQRKMSYKDLSVKANIPESTIKKMFAGNDMKLSSVFRIIDAMSIKLSDLDSVREDVVNEFSPEQEQLFESDITFYNIFILKLRGCSDRDVAEKLGLKFEDVISKEKDMEKSKLLVRDESGEFKTLARHAVTFTSESRFQRMLEGRVASMLVSKAVMTPSATAIRHLASLRMSAQTYERYRREIRQLNDKLIEDSKADIRIMSDQALVAVSFLLCADQIESGLCR
jgi:DNA-binding Xre family transcriptional regulator/transcriptional regulator with XRE-family HTH domain